MKIHIFGDSVPKWIYKYLQHWSEELFEWKIKGTLIEKCPVAYQNNNDPSVLEKCKENFVVKSEEVLKKENPELIILWSHNDVYKQLY
jgi:hypothetical protein